MATDTALARDEQRATVRHLIAQGLGNRAIARHPGTPSRDTVRRWRTEWETEQPPVPLHAPPAPDTRATGARQDVPPATPDPDRLTVQVDASLRDDLAVLAQAGVDAQAGIRLAVQLLADAYRTAWDYNQYDRGTRPYIRIEAVGGRPFPTTPQAAHPNGTRP